jgi:hypothetical protein
MLRSKGSVFRAVLTSSGAVAESTYGRRWLLVMSRFSQDVMMTEEFEVDEIYYE